MPDPIFDTRTPRFDLPLLFAGQAQKEGFVNEVTARIDALLHCAVEAELATPPATPAEGQSWLIAISPTGDWSGRPGQIASRQSGNWLFAVPQPGMRVFNRGTGQTAFYNGSWQTASRPVSPSGGATVDVEARDAIAALIGCLAAAGFVAAS